MAKIGAGWLKTKEDGTQFISIKIDEELLPLTITEKQSLTLFERPVTENTTENSPHYTLSIFSKDKKENK